MVYTDELLDPVLEAGLDELNRMHTYQGVADARETFRQMRDAGRKPVAFWVPKEQCRPPLLNDRWEVLDEMDSQHSGRIDQLRYVATKAAV